MTKPAIVPRLRSSDQSDALRILRSLKAPGVEVRKGEGLLEVETDKVNVAMESPDDGVLTEIKTRKGEFVKFSAVAGVIEKTG